MRVSLRTFYCAALLATVTAGCAENAAPPPGIVGSWEFRTGSSGGQRGLLIFTETHYSMMFVRDTAPRARYPDDRRMTDAETVVAYNSITANSGRYSLVGDSLTVTAYMANDPNYMNDWPDSEMTFAVHVAGDTLTWIDPKLIGLLKTVMLDRVR